MLANISYIVIEIRLYFVWFELIIIPTDIQLSIITIVYGNYQSCIWKTCIMVDVKEISINTKHVIDTCHRA